MKKCYWGFNWECIPFIGQFGLFWHGKNGWRYFGIPFPFTLIALIWFMFSGNKDFMMYMKSKEQRK